MRAPYEIRTRVAGFKVLSANRYTKGAGCMFLFLIYLHIICAILICRAHLTKVKAQLGLIEQTSITPLRISNAHGNVAIPLINRPKLGDLNVQWCKILASIELLLRNIWLGFIYFKFELL